MIRRIKRDERGVTGFFLDLPVFMIICVVLFLFITTASNLYFRYKEVNSEREMEDACLSLNRQVEMYSKILYEEEDGLKYRHFDLYKLEHLNNSNFDNHIDIPTSFYYNVSIEVYGEPYHYNIGDNISKSYKGDICSYISPVTLHDNSTGEEYIGRLSVMVWED